MKVILYRRTRWGEDLPLTSCAVLEGTEDACEARAHFVNLALGHKAEPDGVREMNPRFPVFAKVVPE